MSMKAPVMHQSLNAQDMASLDNIVRSPYPNDSIPENVSLLTFLREATEEDTLDRPYYFDASKQTEYTRRQVLEQSQRVCNALSKDEFGFKPGDFVAIALPNCPEYLPVLLGVTEARLVAVLFNPAWTLYELESITKGMKFVAMFTCSDQVDKLSQASSLSEATLIVSTDNVCETPGATTSYQELLSNADLSTRVTEPLNGNDLTMVFFSSGTSGVPKGVKLSHRNAITTIMSWNRTIAYAYYDSLFCVVPPFHIMGLTSVLVTFHNSCTFVSMPKFVPELFVETIKTKKPTCLFLPPTLISFVANCSSLERKDFAHVKAVNSGGAPLREALRLKFMQKVGNRHIFQAGYGFTEGCANAIIVPLRLANIHHDSIGQVLPNVEMKVVDMATLKPVGPNEKGELCFRGPSIFTGYFGNEEATSKAFDSDGWYRTGDFGYYDAHGLVYIEGRIKDLIKVHAYQVAPEEIENVIRKLDQVQETVVFGIEDEKFGEVPRALVIRLSDSLTEDDVLNVVKDHLAPYKQLRGGVRFVQDIPVTPSGKILRRIAREWDLQNKT